MKVVLIILRYPWWAVPAAFFSMMIFRLPLWLDKQVRFFALMGSGKNGTFDIRPDLRQWAVFLVSDEADNSPFTIPDFIKYWARLFHCTAIIYHLAPMEGHGLWNGKKVFGDLPRSSDYDGEIAILTRATIRLSKLLSFWKNVPPVASKVAGTEGLIKSYGIGEIPLIKQATFSIWKDKASMKAFAYRMHEHSAVITKTRKQDWYKEDMFVRFRILKETTLP